MPDGNVTVMLSKAAAGDRTALDALFPLVYDELRRLAASQMNHEGAGHSLQATGLVHEAYLKLFTQQNLDVTSRSLFFGIAANTMRRILIDHARTRKRQKRGGGADRVSLSGVGEALGAAPELSNEVDIEELDSALTKLSGLSERCARLVELRFFVGQTVDEAAITLGISPRQAADDWRVGKAFLANELRHRPE